MSRKVKTAIRRETSTFPVAGVKAVDTSTGRFEAVVSVFGNLDFHGHRIDPHAFDDSIERWKATGDPIPVIFSHQWDNLDAYLGEVQPDDIEALQPGDADLPEAIREFGGLKVIGSIDTSEAQGRKALKLLKSRAIREFSFAYDVFDEEKADDGFTNLLELDLIETGPTLKGANPLTQLIDAKASDLDQAFAEVFETLGREPVELAGLRAALEALGEPETPTAPDRGAKAFVTIPGTLERLQEALTRQAVDWAADLYAGNLYACFIEGTFTDRVILYVELWDDPPMRGRYFEAGFEADGDSVTLGEPTPIELIAQVVGAAAVEPTLAAGRGRKEGRRNASNDLDRIQSIHNLTRDLGAECEEPDGETGEDPDDEEDTGTESIGSAAAGVIRARLDAALIEL